MTRYWLSHVDNLPQFAYGWMGVFLWPSGEITLFFWFYDQISYNDSIFGELEFIAHKESVLNGIE